ncbi:MAG: short-chain dehydrogenase [Ilumatobacteraceae bacterium]|nr:short-chain dehydrogenase [Ilumatobacteraceae bacterium]
MFELDGRVALVTGAGQGVGAGIATALAAQGAAVAVNDFHADRAAATVAAITGAGGRAVAVPFDVTDHAAVVDGVATAAAALGPVDIMVPNAGIPTAGMPQLPFVESTPELWHRFIDLNLYGVLHCMHAALPSMCERGWGRVIVISSEAGRHGLDIKVALYGAGKAGAVGLLRHVAMEVAPMGVTMNALSLGLIGNVQSDWAAKVARSVPRRRLGTPDDIGGAVAFLASDAADWITGQVLPVNGGSYS